MIRTPPQRTAYFCDALKPGIVFRVQHILASVWVIRDTNREVRVMIPGADGMKFKAVRSADKMDLASPDTDAITVPGVT